MAGDIYWEDERDNIQKEWKASIILLLIGGPLLSLFVGGSLGIKILVYSIFLGLFMIVLWAILALFGLDNYKGLLRE